MLKGLEVSEVRLSELERTSRIDSEFYKKENLNIQKVLEKLDSKPLTDFVHVSDGNHMSISDNFCEKGVPYYRGQDIHDFFIENANPICIPESVFKMPTMSRSHLQKNDVLLSIVGTIGEVSLVNTNANATCSCKLAILRPKANCNAETIALFLQSKYGQNQIKKFIRGAVQMGFILEDVNQINIPNFSNDFQQKIESLVKSAHEKLSRSKLLYAQAEDTLLCELGLKDWQPKNEAVSIKTFSDFASSGRLDAEYYQSKYDELFEKLSKFPQKKIKDITNYPVSSGSTPKAGDSEYYSDEKTGIPFLRAVDIIQSRVDLNDLMYIKSRVHNGLLKRTQLHKGDVLFSIAGTVGRCGIFDYDFEANINQAIAILRFDESVVKHLYVIQFFNSKIGQLVIEKYARQGLQTNLNLEELSNLPIPILPQEIQKQIAELIQTSFALRQESKQLLESAKLAVEVEIER